MVQYKRARWPRKATPMASSRACGHTAGEALSLRGWRASWVTTKKTHLQPHHNWPTQRWKTSPPFTPDHSDTSPLLTHAIAPPPPSLWPARGRTVLPTVKPPSHLSMPLVRLRQQIEVNRSCSFFIICSNRLVGGAPRLERRKRAWKWHLHERWDMCV